MIRSQDVVFHENEKLVEFEKFKKPKVIVGGVLDLTFTSFSLDSVIDWEKVQYEIYDKNQQRLVVMNHTKRF